MPRPLSGPGAAIAAMALSFDRAIAAFADTVVRQVRPELERNSSDVEVVTRFLLAVHKRMPDYLRGESS